MAKIAGLKKILLVFLLFGLFWVAPIGAVEEEALVVDEEDQQKADLLKKEVEAILAETDSQDSDRLMVKKAFCGNLISHRKGDQELSVEVRGQEKIVRYDDETVIIGITREKITPENLEAGSYLIAMGYINRLEPDQLLVKRLVVQETPPPINRESFFGIVGDISSEEEVFVLTQNNLVFEVLAEKADLSYRDEDDKLAAGKFSRLKEQDKVVVVGQRKDDNGRVEASKIHIIFGSDLDNDSQKAE
ncbi:MAG: hypothetical protein PHX72_02040 [Candidatus Shapirobacteria bacterium]|nr:hypothetical protein [Candidatus Shapirobacteria bacterium]